MKGTKRVALVGAALSDIGRVDTKTPYELHYQAASRAIADAGLTKDDIDVSVHNGMLEIKGEKHEKAEDKGKKRSYMVHESHASFYRRLALPDYADADHVDAHFDDGVLKVIVPFKELPKPKKIAIGSGNRKR